MARKISRRDSLKALAALAGAALSGCNGVFPDGTVKIDGEIDFKPGYTPTPAPPQIAPTDVPNLPTSTFAPTLEPTYTATAEAAIDPTATPTVIPPTDVPAPVFTATLPPTGNILVVDEGGNQYMLRDILTTTRKVNIMSGVYIADPRVAMDHFGKDGLESRLGYLLGIDDPSILPPASWNAATIAADRDDYEDTYRQICAELKASSGRGVGHEVGSVDGASYLLVNTSLPPVLSRGKANFYRADVGGFNEPSSVWFLAREMARFTHVNTGEGDNQQYIVVDTNTLDALFADGNPSLAAKTIRDMRAYVLNLNVRNLSFGENDFFVGMLSEPEGDCMPYTTNFALAAKYDPTLTFDAAALQVYATINGASYDLEQKKIVVPAAGDAIFGSYTL